VLKLNEKVITKPLNFVVTANSVVYSGVHPIFLDVDKSTFGLSPDSLLQLLEKHTRQNKKTNNPGK